LGPGVNESLAVLIGVAAANVLTWKRMLDKDGNSKRLHMRLGAQRELNERRCSFCLDVNLTLLDGVSLALLEDGVQATVRDRRLICLGVSPRVASTCLNSACFTYNIQACFKLYVC